MIQNSNLNFEQLLSQPKLWRLQNLYRIKNKQKQLVNLRLNNIQQKIYDSVIGSHTAGVPIKEYDLKYRQGGVSTFWLLFWLDDTIFTPQTTTGILSHERESLKHLWTIISTAYDHMPEGYKPRCGTYNMSELDFPEIGSKIFVSLSIRSTAVHNLHVSEICHIESEDLKASLAAVSPTGNVSCESTAHGMGNDGYTMYWEGKTGANGYKSSFFPWFIQDEYRIELNGVVIHRTQEEDKLAAYAVKDFGVRISDEQVLWRRIKMAEQRHLFAQEFPESDETAFLSTGNPYFHNQKLLALLREAKDNVPRGTTETYEYTQWEAPTKGHLYVGGADVAEGIGNDSSVLKIICVTCRQEAFRYRAHVGVDEFYRICDVWGRAYFKAWLAVERNNHGHAVILGLVETSRYPNLYVQEQQTRLMKIRGIEEKKNIVKIGWETTPVTKPIMMDQLKIGIEGNYLDDVDHFEPEITLHDQIFLQEALTTTQTGIKIGAIEGHHDDVVMGTAIAFQLYLKAKGQGNQNLTDGIYLGDDLTAIGII